MIKECCIMLFKTEGEKNTEDDIKPVKATPNRALESLRSSSVDLLY